MRTTLDIDDELLPALKDLATQQGLTVGQMVSALTRLSLSQRQAPEVRNGVRLFPAKVHSPKPGLDVVNALRDDA